MQDTQVPESAKPESAKEELKERGNLILEAAAEIFRGKDTAVSRDLRLNLERLLRPAGELTRDDAALATLALATVAGEKGLKDAAKKELTLLGLSEAEIDEVGETAAFMTMLNTYYIFRHGITDAQGDEAKERYKRATLRMNAMAKPSLGERRFEMLAFAVSVYNGCGRCMSGHEKQLREHLGVSAEQIHNLARLAAVVAAIGIYSRGRSQS